MCERIGYGNIEVELDWFGDNSQTKCEVKVRGGLGPMVNDDELVRTLNRIIGWKEDGIQYEANR